MGLGLVVGSLPGPWLTVGAPAALAFALHDRRAGVRLAALALLVACALLALATPGGPALLTMAVGALGASAGWVARGRPGALDALAAPSLAGAAAGWGLGAVAAPGAVAAWEAMLARGVAEGGEAALARYRSLGMSAATLASFEGVLQAAAEWTVRLWPALAALALWLGAWLGVRLLARWGRIEPELAQRLAGRRFASFAVREPAVWLLIVALAGLWVPVDGVSRAAANAALVAIVLFGLDGLAVGWWWLEGRRVRRAIALAAGVLAVAFALPVTAAALVALGLADLWLQFRARPGRPRAAGRTHR